MSTNGWIEEVNELWPGQKFCLQTKRVLFKDKSKYQEVVVYESTNYGTVLTLDGIIQCTEKDEASYSEMMAHLPLCSLASAPKRVLVIGGGDGGVVRELNKYKSINRIDVAEIDEMVVDVSKKYLPKMGSAFDDPRVHLHICDGCEYVKNAEEGIYDAVVIDSSDPVGPAVVLYKRPFYESIHRALKPGGAVSCMAECVWLHLDFIKTITSTWGSVFENGSVSYGYVCTPSYPCGQIGILVAMKQDGEGNAPNPAGLPTLYYEEDAPTNRPPMQYYNAKVHSATFELPEFARSALAESLTFQ